MRPTAPLKNTLALGLAAALLVACGGGPPRNYYDTTSFEHEALTPGKKDAYAKEVRSRFKGRKVQVGAKQLSGKDFAAQRLAVLYALFAVSGEDRYGAEADLLVREKGKRPTPVTVFVDKKGSVRVLTGKRLGPPGKAPTADELRARYGTGPFTEKGAKWNGRGLRAVEAALAKLPARERELLLKQPFERTPGRDRGDRGAEHHVENCRERISVYDRAVTRTTVSFAGDPDSPLPGESLTILHELGHALHTRPGRLGVCRAQKLHKEIKKRSDAFNKQVSRFNKGGGRDKKLREAIESEREALEVMTREYEALARKAEEDLDAGPVLAAFRKARGKERAPTRYGETSAAEAFAECFALHYADPVALARVAPRAAKWFAAGGHLSALDDALRVAAR